MYIFQSNFYFTYFSFGWKFVLSYAVFYSFLPTPLPCCRNHVLNVCNFCCCFVLNFFFFFGLLCINKYHQVIFLSSVLFFSCLCLHFHHWCWKSKPRNCACLVSFLPMRCVSALAFISNSFEF